MKMRISAGAAVLLCCVLFLPAGAQKPVQPAPPKQETTLRVTTRLVQVSVIAQNSRNEPVRGLTKDDFILLEDGKEQAISVFSVETLDPATASTAPLPVNTYSNRFEQKAGVPNSVTVILLDELNTRFGDNVYAREHVIKYLSQVEPNDRVALYVLSGRLRVLHDFTNDARPLLRALARHRSEPTPNLDASQPDAPDTGSADLDAWLENANQRMGDFFLRNRVNSTLEALKAIARHLARLPGRKNLVWVSGSFPVWYGMDRARGASNLSPETGTFTQEMETAARILTDANVAVYPVDARGLIGAFSSPTPNAPQYGLGRGPAQTTMPTLSTIGPTHDTMVKIAQDTGGRAFYNTNDIRGSIRRALRDSQLTYTLGYYPTHNKWDGRFREIKVKVKRDGVRVRNRRGYFAVENQPQDIKRAQADLDFAARSPLDASTLGLTVRAEPRSVVGERFVVMNLSINSGDVAFTKEGNRWNGEVDVYFFQSGGDGRRLSGTTYTLSMRLQRERFEEIMKEGLLLDKQLPLATGAEELRIVARDTTTGAIGTVRFALADLKETPGGSRP